MPAYPSAFGRELLPNVPDKGLAYTNAEAPFLALLLSVKLIDGRIRANGQVWPRHSNTDL